MIFTAARQIGKADCGGVRRRPGFLENILRVNFYQNDFDRGVPRPDGRGEGTALFADRVQFRWYNEPAFEDILKNAPLPP
jgi:hypothetical protein